MKKHENKIEARLKKMKAGEFVKMEIGWGNKIFFYWADEMEDDLFSGNQKIVSWLNIIAIKYQCKLKGFSTYGISKRTNEENHYESYVFQKQ